MPRPRLDPEMLEQGYWRAYRDFDRFGNIARASLWHRSLEMRIKHAAYAIGWKRLEPLWNLIIQARRLAAARSVLESILTRTLRSRSHSRSGPCGRPSLSLPIVEDARVS